MEEFAARGNMDVAQMIDALAQSGVSEQSFRSFVRAGITWRELTRARFAGRVSVSEDERGLRVRGRLLSEVRRGAEALALLRAGAVEGLSIGYRTVRAGRLPEGGRLLQEVELWEVSLVTFPMLPSARASAAAADAEEAALAEALSAALSEARGRFGG
jgi:HK97 family phage prohead protease